MKTQKRIAISYVRIFFSLLVFAAIIVQLFDSIQNGRSVANFFSFFTIQSNVIAAFVLLAVGIGTLTRQKANPQFAFIRGGATLYMVMTGIIFALLLAGLQQSLQTTIPWVNTVLHYTMPIVILVDWLLYPPKFTFSFRYTILWLTYPIVYLLYSLIRGEFTNWYPYPFINPLLSGWASVIVMCIIISLGTIALAWLLALRTRGKKR